MLANGGRKVVLERLLAAHQASHLKFFGNHAALADPQAFAAYLAPLRCFLHVDRQLRVGLQGQLHR